MDASSGLATAAAMEIGQGAAGCGAVSLAFKQIDNQRAEQRQIAGRAGVADQAAVFVLGAVTAMVLAVLNGPMVARPSQQLRGGGLLGPATGDGIDDVAGGFEEAALPEGLDSALDANELGGAG
jgi:hypothetical protein